MSKVKSRRPRSCLKGSAAWNRFKIPCLFQYQTFEIALSALKFFLEAGTVLIIEGFASLINSFDYCSLSPDDQKANSLTPNLAVLPYIRVVERHGISKIRKSHFP